MTEEALRAQLINNLISHVNTIETALEEQLKPHFERIFNQLLIAKNQQEFDAQLERLKKNILACNLENNAIITPSIESLEKIGKELYLPMNRSRWFRSTIWTGMDIATIVVGTAIELFFPIPGLGVLILSSVTLAYHLLDSASKAHETYSPEKYKWLISDSAQDDNPLQTAKTAAAIKQNLDTHLEHFKNTRKKPLRLNLTIGIVGLIIAILAMASFFTPFPLWAIVGIIIAGAVATATRTYHCVQDMQEEKNYALKIKENLDDQIEDDLKCLTPADNVSLYLPSNKNKSDPNTKLHQEAAFHKTIIPPPPKKNEDEDESEGEGEGEGTTKHPRLH